MDLVIGLKAIGAGIAALGMTGAGLALGNVAGKFFEAVARQPEVEPVLKGMFILSLAIVEAVALFAFTIAAIILFVI